MSKSTITRTKITKPLTAYQKRKAAIYIIQWRLKRSSNAWSPGDDIYAYKAYAAEKCRRYNTGSNFEYRVVKYLPEEAQ